MLIDPTIQQANPEGYSNGAFMSKDSEVKHDSKCRLDKHITGSCFHDRETGERVSPLDVEQKVKCDCPKGNQSAACTSLCACRCHKKLLTSEELESIGYSRDFSLKTYGKSFYNCDVTKLLNHIQTQDEKLEVLEGEKKAMMKAIVKRAESGHSDTCQMRVLPNDDLPCSCGHFEILSSLSK